MNMDKHGVDFADAVVVLYDELAVTVPDDRESEKRFVTIGSEWTRWEESSSSFTRGGEI